MNPTYGAKLAILERLCDAERPETTGRGEKGKREREGREGGREGEREERRRGEA